MTRIRETAIPHYPKADAQCSCEATHTWDGVECISVRRSALTDRCMECNARWRVPQQAFDLNVPCVKFAARGVPCHPDDGACAVCGNRSAA